MAEVDNTDLHDLVGAQTTPRAAAGSRCPTISNALVPGTRGTPSPFSRADAHLDKVLWPRQSSTAAASTPRAPPLAKLRVTDQLQSLTPLNLSPGLGFDEAVRAMQSVLARRIVKATALNIKSVIVVSGESRERTLR